MRSKTTDQSNTQQANSLARRLGRYLMSGILLIAALAHLIFRRAEFSALVPDWLGPDKDLVVVLTGYIELVLGIALLALPKHRRALGRIIAVYLLLVYIGNIYQFTARIDAFGLNTDLKRGLRLLFQPPMILLALWSGGRLKR